MIKILVTGSYGQLGSELVQLSGKLSGYEFVFTDLDSLDITSFKDVDSIIERVNPQFVINTAGYTAVDKAEKEAEEAFDINSIGVGNLVAALTGNGGRLIHISTDFVFNGEANTPYQEDSQALPLSVYGRSKLSGEEWALAYEQSMVIRTSWLYSSFKKNFVKTIIRLAGEKEELRIVDDQIGSPTYAADLARVIFNIIDQHAKGKVEFRGGIYHYCNSGSCSWYEFACKIKDIMGFKTEIVPVTTEEFTLPARRPAYSVLDTGKIKEIYSLNIPGWEDSLEQCLEIIKRSNNE